MAGPLDHLLVLDTTWGPPGSIAGLLLSDYGARVVKIERTSNGAAGRSSNRAAWDRGKWSVQMDVHSDRGGVLFRDLLRRADVLLVAAPYGANDRWSITREEAATINPQLVYTVISPYGQDETPWRERPGWEALVAARAGFMAEQPGHRPGPIFLGHPSISYITGLLAAVATLAAIRARRLNGVGQQVDVSMFDGVLGQTAINWWWNEKDDSYLATDAQGTFGRRRLIFEMFRCGDGEYLMLHTGVHGDFKKTLDILGLGERIRTIEGALEMAVPLDDVEYEVTRDQVPTAFLTKGRDEWLHLFGSADIAVTPVQRPGEMFDHPQVRFADMVMDAPDGKGGVVRQMRPGIRFLHAAVPDPDPAPTPGEHNHLVAELLSRDVMGPPAAGDQPVISHALQGLRVVDFSQYFAGAFGARLFSDLGADVIKVEPPSMDPMRPLPEPFEGAQRGKRTIAVDLKSREGLEIVRQLVAGADIVVHNWRPGKAESAGIGYEELKKVNPSLIYCYQPGWGSDGPAKNEKSFAPLMSGLVGLLYQAAGEGNQPVRRARASEDYYGGLLGAVGMLVALEARGRTGRGEYLESPQLHATLFATLEQQVDDTGRLVTDNLLDREQMGYGPLYRLYQTADGWVCIAAVGDRVFGRLAAALGPEAGLDGPELATEEARNGRREELAALLSARFRELSTSQAIATLERHGVPVEAARDTPFMPELWWEDWAIDSNRVFEHHHADYGWIREVGLLMRLSATPGLKRGPAPRFGEHTREILEELGYSAERVDELVRERKVFSLATSPGAGAGAGA
jgi:crotonobetainyl-CoA:carnitine CoA-transferase CaiB-like acyl-CoA transferase